MNSRASLCACERHGVLVLVGDACAVTAAAFWNCGWKRAWALEPASVTPEDGRKKAGQSVARNAYAVTYSGRKPPNSAAAPSACVYAATWLDVLSDLPTSASTDGVLHRDCKMAARQLQKQTSRYVDRFGPGAVVFSCGFASSLQVDPHIQIIGFDELQQGVQALSVHRI